ncbi:MAG: hypothetical protein ACE5H4_06590 [Candidatus Thorarchaeota archaeon]
MKKGVVFKVTSLFWEYDQLSEGWLIRQNPTLLFGMVLLWLPGIVFSYMLDTLPQDKSPISIGLILTAVTIVAAVPFRLPGPPVTALVMLSYSILLVFGMIIVPMTRRELSIRSDSLTDGWPSTLHRGAFVVWLLALLSPYNIQFFGGPNSFFLHAWPYQVGLTYDLGGFSASIWLFPFITATMGLFFPPLLLIPLLNIAFSYYVTQYCLDHRESSRSRAILLAFLAIPANLLPLLGTWAMELYVPFPLVQAVGLLLMKRCGE